MNLRRLNDMKKVYSLFWVGLIVYGCFSDSMVVRAEDKYCANAKTASDPYECFLMSDKYCASVSSNKDMTPEDCNKKLVELNKPSTVPAPVAPKAPAGDADKNKTVIELVNPIGDPNDPTSKAGTTGLITIVGKVIASALGILGSLALLVFVYGGFRWITAAGNAEHVKEGSEAMIWATVGICIIFSSYAILKLIFTGLGVTNTTVNSLQIWCYDETTNQCVIKPGGTCSGTPYTTEADCNSGPEKNPVSKP